MKNFDYTGNIILNSESNNRIQSIYASQSYGTFYSVFGTFDIDESDSSKGTKLKSLKLELINYKGLLNMELVNYKFHPELIPIEGTKGTSNNIIGLTVYVKAATVQPAKTDLPIKIEDLKKITFNQGDIFLVRRELLSLYEQNTEEIEEMGRQRSLWKPTLGGVFDNEFYYRNGKLIDTRKDGDFALLDSSSESANLNQAVSMIFDGSPSCHMRGSLISID